MRQGSGRNGWGILGAMLVALTLVLAPLGGADAKMGSGSSSGGYSRPPSSSSTPSYRPPISTPAPSSSPPSSGGYTRPSGGAPASTTTVPRSAGDQAVSRQASGSALANYRASQEQQRFRTTAAAAPPSGLYSQAPRFNSYDSYYDARSRYYGGFGWSPPIYIYQSRPSFGMFDALFLWWMLDTATRNDHAQWFYNHNNDPGYAEWRREADRMAADNAELRAKLDRLDADLKQRQGQPVDPNFLPADVKPELALAAENAVAEGAPTTAPTPPPAESGGGSKWKLGLGILLLAGVVAVFVLRRNKTA